MRTLGKLLLGAVAGAGIISAAPAGAAVTFNLIDTGGAGAGSQARTGFEIAAAYWSSVLTNNVTINLNIGFQSLDPGVLGSTGSNTAGVFVDSTYARLGSTQNSALDAMAVANLRPLVTGNVQDGGGNLRGAVTAVTSGYVDPMAKTGVDTSTTVIDNDGSANNSVLDMNTANAKALGFNVGNVIDGDITFSSDFAFDFDGRDGIDPGKFDFTGVAIHEIGHALGFVSGTDIYDLVGRPDGPLADPFEAGVFGSNKIDEFRVMSVLDLFRYSADGVLDWSVGTASYFSVDGGASQLFGGSLFSTGSFNGDGRQASHWKDNQYSPGAPGCPIAGAKLGIMDPTFARCEQGAVTALDLAAFDAIGWNTSVDVLANQGYNFTTGDAYNYYLTNVPEPATWAQMILGFGFLGGALRRLRGRKAAAALA